MGMNVNAYNPALGAGIPGSNFYSPLGGGIGAGDVPMNTLNPMGGFNAGANLAPTNPAFAANMPNYVAALAEQQSQAQFNRAVGGVLSSAFGGNVIPGPISQLNNTLGDTLMGAGFGNLSMLLPNYMPNQNGNGVHFGPGNLPGTFIPGGIPVNGPAALSSNGLNGFGGQPLYHPSVAGNQIGLAMNPAMMGGQPGAVPGQPGQQGAPQFGPMSPSEPPATSIGGLLRNEIQFSVARTLGDGIRDSFTNEIQRTFMGNA